MTNQERILRSLDSAAAREQLCDEIVADIRESSKRIGVRSFLDDAALVQNLRLFTFLRRITDAYLRYQREHPEVRRRHAQALIEEGLFTAASDVLAPLSKPAFRKESG